MSAKRSDLEACVNERFILPAIENAGFIIAEVPINGAKTDAKELKNVMPSEMTQKLLGKGLSIGQHVWWELYNNHRGIHYDDVQGQPNKSNESRLSADLTSRLVGNIYLSNPLVAANMEAVKIGR